MVVTITLLQIEYLMMRKKPAGVSRHKRRAERGNNMNIEMLYEIPHALNVRTTPDQIDEIKRQLQSFSTYRETLEPYFSTICLWEMKTEDETGKQLYRKHPLYGYWFVSDLEVIKALVDDPDGVKIGNPPITLEQAVAEVEDAITAEKEERTRRAAIVETNYARAIDHYDSLYEYGYRGSELSRIIKLQTAMNEQNALFEIRDQLKTIADCLTNLCTHSNVSDLQRDLLAEQREQM